jgi:hypothetical protein
MRKNLPLRFIQIAWVLEVIALLSYTMLILPLLSTERIGLWVSMLPHILGIIGSQGAAAGLGPLIADYIKTRNQEDHHGDMPGYTRPASADGGTVVPRGI